MNNDVMKVLLSGKEIEKRVGEIAAQITRDYAGESVLMVGILRGAVVFFSELVKRVDLDLRFDFMVVSSYGSGVKSSGVVKIVKDLDINLEGKDILIVEDILDSGMTLDYIKGMLLDRNPSSIRICTLLDKPARRKADIQADYVGFTVPDEFVVGYGLDYDERYRNLPYIGVLKPEVYSI